MSIIMRVAIFILFVCHTINVHGQGARVAVDKDRKIWLGLNVGGFWQGSDIRPAAGAGSGLTFDYYFIRNNTSVFGIGVRAQYLKAASLGLGITRDFNIQSNPSLNGSSGNPDYASLGAGNDYVFQNYSTDISDLSGNVIISLNRLRAVSRINLYVFGGIGGTGFIASMNQRDASGNLYDYNLINSSAKKSAIIESLKENRDDTYETYGEGGSSMSWAFTPTVGAGFGIQLSSRVELAIEHKVGFTGTDLLDGNRFGSSNTRNDIYHYSSFGVNFGLGKLIGGGTTRNQAKRTPILPITPAEAVDNPPAITITSPASSPVTLENCSASIRATVENISSKQGITVMHDRTPVAFEFSGRTITVSNVSFTGTADFVISARNNSGTATKTVSFVCQSPVLLEMITICHRAPGSTTQELSIPSNEWPTHQAHGDTQGACPVIQLPSVQLPVVTITSPATSPVMLENCNASITATVENVTDKQGITVIRDRTPVVFEFSGRTVTVSNVNFTGTANFVITARNNAGVATKTVSFVCQPPVEMVTICHRALGMAPQEMNIPLNEWPAHQAHGDTQGACPVIQLPQVQPPVVTITSPATSPVTLENCSASITAIVDNIANKQGIVITRDRTPVAFEFSGGTVTVSNISFTGTSNFVIRARNSAGTATKTVSFVCQPPVPVEMITICHRAPGLTPQEMSIPLNLWPAHQAHGDTQGACPVMQLPTVQLPVVIITSPINSPVTLENCSASITATVANITNKQSITVTRDRTPVAFEFSGTTVTVSNVSFTGTADFIITATNTAGVSTETVSFVCQPPVSIEMITICHQAPGLAPQEISIPSNEWSSHQAHGDTQGACPVIQTPTVQLPVVTITSPATPSVTLANCKASITATVDNITSKQGITVTQNETPVTFDFANNTVTVSNINFTGTANFVIKATNSAGSATKTVSFVCQPPVEMITICHQAPGLAPQEISIPSNEWPAHQVHGDTQGACPVIQTPTVQLPVVTITSPATSSVTLENCKASITATVDNIASKQGVTLTQNETPVTFDFANNTVTVSNVNFTGTANFVIKATNSAGSATKTVSFVCQPPVEMITICHRAPGLAPQEMSIPSNEWSSHQAHGDTQGACPVVLAPVVTLTAPSTSPLTVEECKASFTATVENIAAKEGITVTRNQTPVQFEFANNTVSVANLDFTGTASFVITATNSAGTASQTASFVCQPPVQMITICHRAPGQNPETISIAEAAWPTHQAHGDTQGACPVIQAPVVTITSPATPSVTLENCKASITATVDNITSKQGITVTQNETPVTFDFANKTVTVSNVNFTGTANFVIKATNTAGSATKTVSFVCQPKEITICHLPPGNTGNPQTITIPESAWPAHEAHGDTQGACPVVQLPVVTITSPATPSVTLENCKASITATVDNITSKEGITVTQNERPVTFVFVNKTITVANFNFEGTSNFVIQATNSAGTATKTVSFVCETREEEKPKNEKDDKSKDQDSEQITICHHPPGNRPNFQTLTIPASAWPAHEKHGDTKGPCKD